MGFRHSGQYDIVATTGIDNQELSIGPIRPGKGDPSIAWRGDEGIRWVAGEGTEIELASCDRTDPGTMIRLELKSDFYKLAESPAQIEAAIKEYADYLPIPIYLNGMAQRANVINAAWFDTTPDPESVELALAEKFNEAPLDIIPIRIEKPVSIAGALYVTPQRTPGFAGEGNGDAISLQTIEHTLLRSKLPPYAVPMDARHYLPRTSARVVSARAATC